MENIIFSSMEPTLFYSEARCHFCALNRTLGFLKPKKKNKLDSTRKTNSSFNFMTCGFSNIIERSWFLRNCQYSTKFRVLTKELESQSAGLTIARVRRALNPDFAMSDKSTPATDRMKQP